jgi:small conductance mechanosensitive channel|tara:strand:- start:2671 stop:4095 length:1425 start_codon:yes stop_codon:yes gene_type:complete
MRFITFTLLLLWSCLGWTETDGAAADGGEINRESVSDLIATLENDGEREALIEQLKLMIDAQPEPELPFIATLFDIDAQAPGLMTDLMELIRGYGLPESFIGDLLTFSVTVFLVLIGLFLNGALSKFFDRRMDIVRKRLSWDDKRFSSIFRIQRWAGYLVSLILIGYATWHLIATSMGKEDIEGPGSLLSAVLTIALVGMVFSMIWEAVNALLESMIEKNERLNSSRFQTITPIIRNILMIALTIMSLMVILSELGINIMPLLAGAGVLGIAIGFGAQTLVKDFLTGLMVVFEDLLQIGDVVRIGDKFGFVEKITLRKVQLRDLDGTVHTVPFGDVTIVSNLTKEFSYYVFEVGVAYRENVDDVMALLKELDEVFRQDESFGSRVLAPLEVQGLDRFDDSAVVIKARYKTKSHERWNVGREFNRRIKAAFDQHGIEIPFPHQTIYFGEDKQGNAPKANVQLMKASNSEPSEASK